MPRIVDYPRASLDAALELAKAVDSLGGSCTEEMAGERTGKKAGGGNFRALIAAAVKYGLVENRKGVVTVTPLFNKQFKLAYDDDQRVEALRRAFLGVPLFRKVYDRFVGNPVPLEYLGKLLIREFDVPEALASKVGKYFIDAASMSRLLSDAGVIMSVKPPSPSPPPPGEPDPVDPVDLNLDHEAGYFVVRIAGPGVNTTIEVRSGEDLAIVEVILKKLRKTLGPEEGVGPG